jgi:hypothetical protein
MLRAYSDVKTLSIALGITLTLGATLGYTLSPKPKQRALMCKLEIDQVNLLNQQIEDLRKSSIEDKARVHNECLEQQQESCATKITKYRSACLELKCAICQTAK